MSLRTCIEPEWKALEELCGEEITKFTAEGDGVGKVTKAVPRREFSYK